MRTNEPAVKFAPSITGFGLDYEKRISKKTALAFAGMYPLPKIGYEIVVAIVQHKYGFKNRLLLQNISGIYVLCSSDTPKSDWPEVFKVTP